MRQIQFNNGLTINMDTVTNVTVQGQTITFNQVNNPTTPYTFLANDPSWVMQQINRFLSGVGTYVTIQDQGDVVLQSVSPLPFTLSTDTISIFGTGFTPGIVGGVIRVEDWPGGGTDSNGPTMTPSFISANEISAVFATWGDSVYAGSDTVIYYTAPNGKISNVLHLGLNVV